MIPAGRYSKLLRWGRRLIELLVLIGFVCVFFWPELAWLPKTQLIPAGLRSVCLVFLLTIVVLLLLVCMTLLFGRIYCSTLCPLGILQDIFSWLARKVFRTGKLRPRKNHKSLRYLLVFGLVFAAAAGGILPLAMLEPYSFFGRAANGVVKPAALWVNNLLYRHANSSFFEPSAIPPMTLHVAIFVAAAFLAMIVVSGLFGRLFCNTLCPAGALLGLLSRRAVFQLKLNSNCIGCRACEKVCKAGCIDLDKRELDFERCVMCLNCTAACRFQAVEITRQAPKQLSAEKTDESRRNFLLGMGAVGASALLLPPILKPLGKSAKTPIMPPGAGAVEDFTGVCTSCHLCVSSCPGKVIKPSFLEYGAGGMMIPRLDFSQGMCEYDCSKCSNVCPTGALTPLTIKRKQRVRIGMVKYYQQRCVVVTDEAHCGACAEHCPTGAIQMKPWRDGLVIPRVFPEYCVGCGSCEYICPVRPEKAVIVEGLQTQQAAKRPPVGKKTAAKPASNAFPF